MARELDDPTLDPSYRQPVLDAVREGFSVLRQVNEEMRMTVVLLIRQRDEMREALRAVLRERETGARLNCWAEVEAALARADGRT